MADAFIKAPAADDSGLIEAGLDFQRGPLLAKCFRCSIGLLCGTARAVTLSLLAQPE